MERHNGTGHVGLGLIHGLGLKKGALASTVSHDSHNIIVIGTNEEDMALCVNEIIEMQGGLVVVNVDAQDNLIIEIISTIGKMHPNIIPIFILSPKV